MPEYLLTVQEDEDGLFIRIPADVVEQLDASQGNRLNLAQADGGFLLSSIRAMPEEDQRRHQSGMAAADEVMSRYAGALGRLANS